MRPLRKPAAISPARRFARRSRPTALEPWRVNCSSASSRRSRTDGSVGCGESDGIMVETGLDVAIGWLRDESRAPRDGPLAEAVSLLRNGRLGLVTNPSAVTRELVSAPDALVRAGAELAALFGPEHGVRGDYADGKTVEHGRDETTGVPAWSLYSRTLAPTAEMLRGLDVLLFDVQDVGARFYTFASTLSYVMESAAESGLPLVVLDRPNPIGGVEIEGPILEP